MSRPEEAVGVGQATCSRCSAVIGHIIHERNDRGLEARVYLEDPGHGLRAPIRCPKWTGGEK